MFIFEVFPGAALEQLLPVDPSGERLLFRSRFIAIVVAVWLGIGFHAHLPQRQDAPVGFLHIPHQCVGPESGGRYASFFQVSGGPLNYRQHLRCVAGQTDESNPVQPCQHPGGFRGDLTGIQPLVEIHPYRFPAHAVDLLQSMVRGQDVVVHQDHFPAVRALDPLPDGGRADHPLFTGYDAPFTIVTASTC